MDQLIAIIIVLAVSAVATLLKKLKQGEEKQDQNAPPLNRPRPPRPQSAPQRPTTSWEDELRRLLGDEDAPPPASPRPPPAPVIRRPPPTIAPQAPAPSPVVRAPAPIQPQLRPQPMAAPRPRVVIAPAARPVPLPSDPLVTEPAILTQAQQAFQQAARLSQDTSARIVRVAAGPIRSTIVEHRAPSAEIEHVVALFKNARTARQAVIASMILGPPPALEPSSTYF